MKLRRSRLLSLLLWLVALGLAVSGCGPGCPCGEDLRQRFGVAAPLGSQGYDLAALRPGAYIDWQAGAAPRLPAGVEYVRVLRVSDERYAAELAALPERVRAFPGATWIVGNEPDQYYQDNVSAEVYAQRYFELASLIRAGDAGARIGFGAVVQPTPIRMRYLARALDHLAGLAGGAEAASDLIDIWSIHAFILNEAAHEWGAGIPPGFADDAGDAVRIPIQAYRDTCSVAIFSRRILDFRRWMADHGQRDKPLWISEYGCLFPPLDPPGTDYYNLSDEEVAAYMQASFDFLIAARDDAIGLPTDDNRLVQRWFWYSLNDHRDVFGGSLFDPDDRQKRTLLGQAWIDYIAELCACPR